MLRYALAALFLVVLPIPHLSHGQETGPDPEAIFEHIWETLDRTYAQFPVKKVDWNALYRVYRPQVTPAASDDELHRIVLEMLHHLNDGHVCIQTDTTRVCVGQADEIPREGFSRDLIVSTYLKGDTMRALESPLTCGWLSDRIGYLHIEDFKDKPGDLAAAIDACMATFTNAAGLVVDVRDNTGGRSANAELAASRFADRRRHFATSYDRYGKDHDDFLPPSYRHVQPDGPAQFTKPTLVLTDRHTESGAEGFVLAMRVLPHVTIVGDLTAGALSAQYPERLPNGWTLWVPFKNTRDHEGLSWEGVGIPPDVKIKNTQADVDAGRDLALEFAIRYLETGRPAPREHPNSLASVKESLADRISNDLETRGLEAATNTLARGFEFKDPQYYLCVVEVLELARGYFRSEKYAECIALLELCRANYPQIASIYGLLAGAYLNTDDEETARLIVAEGDKVEAMYPWEKPFFERVKAAVNAPSESNNTR
ncbi:MAG: S41 family peptidase [bacterium]